MVIYQRLVKAGLLQWPSPWSPPAAAYIVQCYSIKLIPLITNRYQHQSSTAYTHNPESVSHSTAHDARVLNKRCTRTRICSQPLNPSLTFQYAISVELLIVWERLRCTTEVQGLPLRLRQAARLLSHMDSAHLWAGSEHAGRRPHRALPGCISRAKSLCHFDSTFFPLRPSSSTPWTSSAIGLHSSAIFIGSSTRRRIFSRNQCVVGGSSTFDQSCRRPSSQPLRSP